jgi:acylphosphatase
MQRLKLRITGKVQGVFYRKSALETAQQLQLGGFVRNQPDGSVLLEAEGPAEKLQKLLEWCKEGPPAARVDKVEETWLEPRGHSEFSIKL